MSLTHLVVVKSHLQQFLTKLLYGEWTRLSSDFIDFHTMVRKVEQMCTLQNLDNIALLFWEICIYIKIIRRRTHAHFFMIFKPRMPLLNQIRWAKFQFCILIDGLVKAFYMFSINSVLWACQWSDYAHLRTRSKLFTKKYVYYKIS